MQNHGLPLLRLKPSLAQSFSPIGWTAFMPFLAKKKGFYLKFCTLGHKEIKIVEEKFKSTYTYDLT